MLISGWYFVSKSERDGHRNHIGPQEFRSPTSQTQSYYDSWPHFWIRRGEFKSPFGEFAANSIRRRRIVDFESIRPTGTDLRHVTWIKTVFELSPAWNPPQTFIFEEFWSIFWCYFSIKFSEKSKQIHQKLWKHNTFSAVVFERSWRSQVQIPWFMLSITRPNHRIIWNTFFDEK